MIIFVVALALGLLALPAVTGAAGRRLSPREWARYCTFTIVAGAALLEAALIVWAVPSVLRLFDAPMLAAVCERTLGRLIPGAGLGGWIAGAAAVGMGLRAWWAWAAARRATRRLLVESTLGVHTRHGEHELVVLPTDIVLAFSVAGDPPQIVLTKGVLRRLQPDQITAVLRHEAAHLEHRHQRVLLVVTAVEKGLWVLPLVGRSTSVLRLALERWADEAAAGETETQREAVRRALESLAESPPTGAAVAAFTGADTVLERLSALRDGPPRPSLCQHTAAYLPGCFLFAGAGLVLSLSGGAAHAVLTLAAHCPT